MHKRMISGLLTAALLLGMPVGAAAETTTQLKDESIYDLLVDRYFNKQRDNDFEADARDLSGFTGGDFSGIADHLDHISDMGFTVVSIGPVFAADSYDGKQVIDYEQLERHFGTPEELQLLIEEAEEWDLKIMVDVPTQTLSTDHTWMSENPEWFTETGEGTAALDTANEQVQEALIETFTQFVGTYNIDGLRLQTADQLDPGFVSAFSEAVKEVRDIYVVGDREMEPVEGLDATVKPGIEDALRSSFKNFDQGLGELPALMEHSEDYLIQIDSLLGSRFTADIVDVRGYPPTRWNVLMAQFLTMPGIPVMQYGSEIAMNGETLPEAHQIMDLAVDEELGQQIADLNSLRNQSAALRTGELEILHDEDDWLVYKRSNDEESWIIAINNSSSTKHLNVSADVIGENKEMRGLFESDIVRENDNGDYRITIDRELAETYHVRESEGLNTAYIVTLIVMYLVFMAFLWIVWRKGKQRKADEAAKERK